VMHFWGILRCRFSRAALEVRRAGWTHCQFNRPAGLLRTIRGNCRPHVPPILSSNTFGRDRETRKRYPNRQHKNKISHAPAPVTKTYQNGSCLGSAWRPRCVQQSVTPADAIVWRLCRVYDGAVRSVSNSYAVASTFRFMRSGQYLETDRPPMRGICLVVKGRRPGVKRGQLPDSPGAATKFPHRPDPGALSESIPLFFIARNNGGLWIAREAEGRIGGVFLFSRSAQRFALKHSGPTGCATMFLAERFELDIANQGNPLAAWFDKICRRVARLIPDHPPPIPIARRIFEGERR
jgi:hypothetical protein